MTPEEVEAAVTEELSPTGRKKHSRKVHEKPITAEEKARIERWATWSLQQHTVEEIREEILTDYRCVCFTYLCGACRFPMSFLDEFLTLSTTLLDKTNYEKDYQKVHDLLMAKLEVGDYDKNLKEIEICNRDGRQIITIDDIADRLDWRAISTFQTLDLYTAEKYGKYLIWDEMTPRCGLSKMFIDANKQFYGKKVKPKDDLNTTYDLDDFEEDMDEMADFEFDDDFLD